MNAEKIARALGGATRSAGAWKARCPAHDDHDPSLSISDQDGKILVHCHAGCSQDAVIGELSRIGLWLARPVVSSETTSPSKPKEPQWKPQFPVPPTAPAPEFTHKKLGTPSARWEYCDQSGRTLGYVMRFDEKDGRKTYRPLTYCRNSTDILEWRWKGFDDPLPLYGLDRLAKYPDSRVVIAEGEKAADAVARLLPDAVAVSWPHGAKSAKRVDWSPLKGRSITIWPDADEEGEKAARVIASLLYQLGIRDVRSIKPPAQVSRGWDAADALDAGISPNDISELLQTAVNPGPDVTGVKNAAFRLSEWTASRFAGLPPERRWLIGDVIPLGTPSMLAAFGGIGKSMLALRLALEVACGGLDQEGGEPIRILGGEVVARGSAVIITAEDDAAEVHRRLHALDPDDRRLEQPDRLIIVPLPDLGGIMTLLQGGYDGAKLTDEFTELSRQLREIPDLRLVVFDPLQAFVAADANKDPAAGQLFCALLGQLASDTGAAVIATHHFRKQGKIKGPSQAREAVRGTTALIDGMRCVYALWPAQDKHARKVSAELGLKHEPNSVVHGAVVKANWPIDRTIHTHVRNEIGLLCDRTNEVSGRSEDYETLIDMLVSAIGTAASEQKPYNKTGSSGVYQRREELPLRLRKVGRNRLEIMVQELLDQDRVRKCSVGKSGVVKWLDIPGGKFERGEGSFTPGALRRTS